jgi:hypothetical protein
MEIVSEILDGSVKQLPPSYTERNMLIQDAIIGDDPFDLGTLDLPANSLDARILTELKLHSKLLYQLLEHIRTL